MISLSLEDRIPLDVTRCSPLVSPHFAREILIFLDAFLDQLVSDGEQTAAVLSQC